MNVKKKGFSLVELLVSMLAATILALAVTMVFIMPHKSMRTNTEYVRLRQDMAYALGLMAREIRTSSTIYNAIPITTGENTLILPPNDLRTETVKYERSTTDGVLTHYIDDVAQGPVIPVGLTRFFSETATNTVGVVSGVTLHFELENSDGEIVIAHETFIHTRN